MKYTLSYDGQEVAQIEIVDSEVSRAAIKEMVEFWSGWRRALFAADGNYTQCWLRKLARFIVLTGAEPQDEEGWYPLDGSKDIRIISITPWEPEEIHIDIEESE